MLSVSVCVCCNISETLQGDSRDNGIGRGESCFFTISVLGKSKKTDRSASDGEKSVLRVSYIDNGCTGMSLEMVM